jgi:hypothetical protein
MPRHTTRARVLALGYVVAGWDASGLQFRARADACASTHQKSRPRAQVQRLTVRQGDARKVDAKLAVTLESSVFSPPALRRRTWIKRAGGREQVQIESGGDKEMKANIFRIALLAVSLLTLFGTAPAQRGRFDRGERRDLRADRRDIRRDTRDIRSDRGDIRQDVRERRADVRDIRQDRREGASRQELREDRREIRSDTRDIRGDRRDIRGDVRDRRGDVWDYRHDRREARRD